MRQLLPLFIFLLALANFNCEQNYDVGFKSIQPVLDYLKSKPEQYNIDYISAKLIKTQIKDDMIDLDLVVTGDCIKFPCKNVIQCKALLNLSLEVLNVNCQNDVDEESFVPSKNISCFGCLEDVNVNAKGISSFVDLIIEHVESEKQIKFSLVDVVKAQRQVINGFKYILTIRIAPTLCNANQICLPNPNESPITCQVSFIQESGSSKPLKIVSNTCTESQTFISRTDTNSIYAQTSNSKKWHQKSDNEVLSDIVSQIIPNDRFIVNQLQEALPTEISHKNAVSSIENIRIKNIESSSVHNLETGPAGIVSSSSFQEVFATEDKPISPGTDSGEQVATSNDPTADVLSLSLGEKQNLPEETKKESPKDTVLDHPSIETDFSQDTIPLKRTRRMIVNSYKISAKERRIIHDLSNYVAKTLDDIDDDNRKRIVLSIINVKKVKTRDELFYHLVLRIGVSHCKENSSDVACESELIDDLTKICKIQVAIRDGDYSKPKIVKSHCQNIKRPHTRDNRTFQGRVKRQLVGGKEEMKPSDPTVLKLLDETIVYLNENLYRGSPLKVIKVIKATSQVVAGISYDIEVQVGKSQCPSKDSNGIKCGKNDEICNINVWDRPWIPSKEVTVNCPSNEKPVKFDLSKKVTKRSVPGGTVDVDKDHPQILEYLQKSLQHMDLNSPQENKYKVKEIISVTRQVVAGSLWRINVKVIESDCGKNDVTDREQCGELQGVDPKICTIKVWDRPWIPQGRETNITCENQKTEYSFRTKRAAQYNHPLGQGDHDFHFSMYQDFIKKYNKTYSSQKEYKYRFSVFRENMKFVKLLNQYEQGTAIYGVTEFADISQKEFSKMLGYRPDLRNENEAKFMQADIPDIELPTSFDWRDKGAVAEVKNQGSCGSCWAFSVTGNVEGQYAIKYGALLEFSEQELVDCDTEDNGCNGGLMDNAYRQIEKLGGLELEQAYPYEAKNEKCHFKKELASVQLSGAINISSDETNMAKWLTQNGPISIAINANAMQFYVGGVSHPWKFLCNPNSLDHGVLIVGYGIKSYPKFKKDLPYWIVKNSWGKRWGEQGYYRVYRGDGTCGVNQTPSSAILK